MRNAVQAVCFDLDSTLRDSRQRHHMSPVKTSTTWDEYAAAGINDAPMVGSIVLTHVLYPHYQIHIVSGSSDAERPATLLWLQRHSVTYDFLKLRPAEQEPTANADFKIAYIRNLRARGTDPVLFVEDWGPVAAKITAETDVACLVVNPLYPCQNCEHDVMAGSAYATQ